jgi:hypothetical protein
VSIATTALMKSREEVWRVALEEEMAGQKDV